MDFSHTLRAIELQQQVRRCLDDMILPAHAQWQRYAAAGIYPLDVVEPLKREARALGLWNLFLPTLRDDEPGTRLSNVDYAPLAEIMGPTRPTSRPGSSVAATTTSSTGASGSSPALRIRTAAPSC